MDKFQAENENTKDYNFLLEIKSEHIRNITLLKHGLKGGTGEIRYVKKQESTPERLKLFINRIKQDSFLLIETSMGTYELTQFGIKKQVGGKFIPFGKTDFIETGLTWLSQVNAKKDGKSGIWNNGTVDKKMIEDLLYKCFLWLEKSF